jgi:hypothetical protein
LTRVRARLKYRKIVACSQCEGLHAEFLGMSSRQPEKPPPSQKPGKDNCKHPRVQIVARQEDAEYVECVVCGEVFESSEFKDMNIEERTALEDS